jgi:hypothetical protein
MLPEMSRADGRSESKRYDSYRPGTTFYSQNRNRKSGSGVSQRTTPCAYWEDTGKKDKGRSLLDEDSAPLERDNNNPIIIAATTPTAGEDGGTSKTPSK